MRRRDERRHRAVTRKLWAALLRQEWRESQRLRPIWLGLHRRHEIERDKRVMHELLAELPAEEAATVRRMLCEQADNAGGAM